MTENINSENVILIGMPGAGKSTCGVLAAKLLLKNFFDTDLLIQSRERKRLQQIIDESGLAYFKKAEEEAILSLDIAGAVIATGGSVVYSDAAMCHLKETGKVIYLHLSFEEMQNRINNLSSRGIALENGETLRDMYDKDCRFMKSMQMQLLIAVATALKPQLKKSLPPFKNNT